MSALMGRRAFLQGCCTMLAFSMLGCASTEPGEDGADQPVKEEAQRGNEVDQSAGDDVQSQGDTQPEDGTTEREESSMKISVTVNGTPFTATIKDTDAGKELLARLPLTLQMEELHGNEKYCYTGEPFGGEQQAPETIEAGDLMVFGSDCLVLFYETFSNGGWSYARVGKIDDPSGLADACGTGTATVEFASLA